MNATAGLLDLLGTRIPIVQAPMAGVSTPAMAAAVSEAGALGSLGLGATGPAAVRRAIEEVQALTAAPVNVNFFCHAPPRRDAGTEAAWIARAAPLFEGFAATPPGRLREIYDSFRETDAFLDILLELRPRVASFHFGLPRPDQMAALRAAGLVLVASVTSLAEARAAEAAGCHALVAQGWEAGGHRGIFDPDAPDERLPLRDLLAALAGRVGVPVIAAGGIMDGAGAAAALRRGAAAAQLGTAFASCPESAADAAYRDRLAAGGETVMTAAISGRPARCLSNDFTRWAQDAPPAAIPAYPCAYDLGKALNAAAAARGVTGFGAQWAGTGAGCGPAVPAAE
ncbi:NAD(P)H-dependent flavin oxidoreductase, partial [Mangrovicoccus algicola]